MIFELDKESKEIKTFGEEVIGKKFESLCVA